MKLKYTYILGIFIVMGLALITAVEINVFDNGASSVNFTFTGSQNITRNFTFYYNATITGAFVNVSGFNTTCYQEFFNESASCGGLPGGNISYWGDWNDTFQHNISYSINGIYEMNTGIRINAFAGSYPQGIVNVVYVVPVDFAGATWDVWHSGYYSHYVINRSCNVGGILNLSLNATYYVAGTGHQIINVSCSGQEMYYSNGTGGTFELEEEGVNWTIYPINTSIKINNTHIWNFTGEFNHTNNRTNDFTNVLNSALNKGACNCTGCELAGTSCYINYTVHSDSSGIINLSNLNITWYEYNRPNLTLIDPNATFNEATNIPIRFYAVDDWELDTCNYSVMRGASLEVANTQINCSKNTTFTVSGDATYIFRMCVNDTSGNINCTNSTFITTNYKPPSSGGGGGGGKTIIEKLMQEVKTPVCDVLEVPWKVAWKAFVAKPNWTNLKKAWLSFWDVAICTSSASFVPMYNYSNSSS